MRMSDPRARQQRARGSRVLRAMGTASLLLRRTPPPPRASLRTSPSAPPTVWPASPAHLILTHNSKSASGVGRMSIDGWGEARAGGGTWWRYARRRTGRWRSSARRTWVINAAARGWWNWRRCWGADRRPRCRRRARTRPCSRRRIASSRTTPSRRTPSRRTPSWRAMCGRRWRGSRRRRWCWPSRIRPTVIGARTQRRRAWAC